MNVSVVLANTLSPDAAIRDNAEKQLATAAETHFQDYLLMLSAEMAKEETPAHIRAAAGLALKNAVSVRDPSALGRAAGPVVEQGRSHSKGSDQGERPKNPHIRDQGSDALKQSSLTTIGYIAESEDADLRESLAQHSNAILTAVVRVPARRKPTTRCDMLPWLRLEIPWSLWRTNFENEGERNYIMQVICEVRHRMAPGKRRKEK
ncbi:hypothetical protein FN846DRAFT_892179 [Sphaerosporella brunnea]|uniref:Importin N-terminal domain-containing protein n=1 Tax=Sphaerosporella brunnea TaxID=1250544 RepID=A0A5J5ER01_9PEZI|nr:hypothetical protein FN846DRAFT_892179 [Sphaerosporella brunnea]